MSIISRKCKSLSATIILCAKCDATVSIKTSHTDELGTIEFHDSHKNFNFDWLDCDERLFFCSDECEDAYFKIHCN
jgi:hypothetical protein